MNSTPRSTPVDVENTHKTAAIFKQEGNNPYRYVAPPFFTKYVDLKLLWRSVKACGRELGYCSITRTSSNLCQNFQPLYVRARNTLVVKDNLSLSNRKWNTEDIMSEFQSLNKKFHIKKAWRWKLLTTKMIQGRSELFNLCSTMDSHSIPPKEV